MDFDKYSASYGEDVDDVIAFSGQPHEFFLQVKADEILRILDSESGGHDASRVLDFGCGVGGLSALMAPRVGQLSGVDISEESIAEARRRVPAADFSCYPAGDRLPCDDAAFDLVFASCVFHHIPPADRMASMREIARVLKPGGIFVMAEHNPWNPVTRHVVSRCPFDADAVLLSHREARRLIIDTDLAGVSVQHILFVPAAAALARRFDRLLRFLPMGAQYLCWGRKAAA